MIRSIFLAGSICLMALAWDARAAEEKGAPATQPVDTHPVVEQKPKASKHPRVIFPFNKLEDLTDAQRAQLGDIRREFARKLRELRRQRHDQMMAVLTEAQQAEVKRIEEESRMRRKQNQSHAERAADPAEAASTQPAQSDDADPADETPAR